MESNLLLAAFAVLAGAFSVLTPCVLVMLPAILAVTGGEGRRRVIGVIIGLEVSFIGISLLAGAALAALGLPPRTQELVAVAIIAALGVTLLVPWLHRRLELYSSVAVSRMPGISGSGGSGDGFRGGIVGGLGLGLVWAPCAGPILAFVTAAANTQGFTSRSVIVAVAYGIGMLGPLLLVFRGGHAAVGRLRSRFGSRRIDLTMGIAMVGTAALILFGGFTTINREITERVNLTSTPIASIEERALDRANEGRLRDVRAASGQSPGGGRPSDEELRITGYPESTSSALRKLGDAPPLTGIGRQYNAPKGVKIDAEFLRGKVVVYDFWTYSCINCIRTIPHLRELHDRYAKDGLVILGVHSPEFAFEKDESNVRSAIKDLDVTWPVVTDPDFSTWRSFHNRFWPAKYITDRDGQIRYVHYGEGSYDTTEAVIRELLAAEGDSAAKPAPVVNAATTPETYLGSDRISPEQWRSQRAGSSERISSGSARYELTGGVSQPLAPGQVGITGSWSVEPERSVAAGDDSELILHYQAQRVFLVLDPGTARRATVLVHDSADPPGARPRAINVTSTKLYTLRDGPTSVDATMRLELPRGVSAYAFTFG